MAESRGSAPWWGSLVTAVRSVMQLKNTYRVGARGISPVKERIKVSSLQVAQNDTDEKKAKKPPHAKEARANQTELPLVEAEGTLSFTAREGLDLDVDSKGKSST